MKRGRLLGALVAPLLAACGSLIGAEWDGTLRPEIDAALAADALVDTGARSDGGADADGGPPACDACTPIEATKIAAGEDHTCAIVKDGILCWGGNHFGQLGTGDGSTLSSATPLRVAGITGATEIAAGYSHTCAIDQAGAVLCWGSNSSGELGGGSKTPDGIATPLAVVGLPPGKATAVAASWAHSCAVVAGALYCWGHNQYNQLGIGASSSPVLVPTQVSGLTTGVTAVAAAIQRTCAIVAGSAKCWGMGGLGNGTVNGSATPVDVFGITAGATAIGTGAAVSCVVVAGAVSCWGISDQFVLGDGDKTIALNPNPVPNVGAGATSVGVGDHACALVAGGVRCWGDYPGNGTATSKFAVSVSGPGGTSVSALAVGQSHACAIASAGAVWCWGSNTFEKLGVSRTSLPAGEALTPRLVGK